MKYGSIINLIEEGIGNKSKLEIGVGVTMLSWSDRTPGTIIAFDKEGKWIDIQEDAAKRIDKNYMSDTQTYEYIPNPKGCITRYKRARNGKFTDDGKNSGAGLIIGVREKYYDYSF